MPTGEDQGSFCDVTPTGLPGWDGSDVSPTGLPEWDGSDEAAYKHVPLFINASDSIHDFSIETYERGINRNLLGLKKCYVLKVYLSLDFDKDVTQSDYDDYNKLFLFQVHNANSTWRRKVEIDDDFFGVNNDFIGANCDFIVEAVKAPTDSKEKAFPIEFTNSPDLIVDRGRPEPNKIRLHVEEAKKDCHLLAHELGHYWLGPSHPADGTIMQPGHYTVIDTQFRKLTEFLKGPSTEAILQCITYH